MFAATDVQQTICIVWVSGNAFAARVAMPDHVDNGGEDVSEDCVGGAGMWGGQNRTGKKTPGGAGTNRTGKKTPGGEDIHGTVSVNLVA